ncbi:hypothetical protein [Streptomyces nogalater]|uniref:Uncharacterized protein n=1 Tax=Streptomyces nogalater TaxID=38314 RepID=A0ABW0W8B6_STRNO
MNGHRSTPADRHRRPGDMDGRTAEALERAAREVPPRARIAFSVGPPHP